MAETKTRPTSVSVDEYLVSKASPAQLADCRVLMALLTKVTKHSPKMWGSSIVGYGSYSYRYESGRTGESSLTGFAVRGRELVVYLVAEGSEQPALLAKLGKHKMGKACLYFKRLADLDQSTLEKLVSESVAETKRRHAGAGDAQPVA
ncbi:MAG: DUF1801 domain-containing protein [Betaproteobacteria bacterium]